MKMKQLSDTELSTISGGSPPFRTITFQREGIGNEIIIMPPAFSGRIFAINVSANASFISNPGRNGVPPGRMNVTVVKS